jgi:hypothetical protein
MMQYHKYSLEELEEMIPFEREIYVTMLMNHLEEERERIKERNKKLKEEEQQRTGIIRKVGRPSKY